MKRFLVMIGRALAYVFIQSQNIHDLYTVAAGLYICWLGMKVWLLTREWLNQGWNYGRRVVGFYRLHLVKNLFEQWFWLVVRLTVGILPLIVVIPFMVGLWFTVLVVGPLRVNAYQTPLFFLWKEWAMGVVHFKLFCASVLMGPEWWLKNVFEQACICGGF